MNVEEYRELLHDDISIAAAANISSVEEEFIKYVTDILSAAEEFDDFIDCHYEGVTRRNAIMTIDGYAMDESDDSCCIFISDYHGPKEDDSIRAEDISASFKKIRYFVEEAINSALYRELEESTEAFEFARFLFKEHSTIGKFRFFLLTDAYNKQRRKNIKDSEVAGKIVELNVWDVTRIFDVVNSQTQKESVEINIDEFGINGIPCVKAVECHNVLADIPLSPKFDDEDSSGEEQEKKPENVITYSSYLAVVPGQLLNDIYLEYGSRLLEGNVRSFLSVKGKVNKSIQNTIKNYPEMFFAYNNGIAATATELDTEKTEEGLKITRIKDLQIVNGGQTTASIANTLLTARKDDKIDISNLFVPMKISVLEHSMSEKIIPKISEYSNSQNKVDASDFFSNHPFHIRIEGYSRKTPAPAVNGNQYQQYWFYERTRGQYNQGKMKFRANSQQLKQYETRYPEKQVIKMVDLAKYMEIYAGAPDVVSRGKQAIVKVFSEEIKKQWEKSDTEFNVFYFKRAVALAIIFRETDEIIKETKWYKEKHSYKANVIAYTMSVLFYIIRRNKPDFDIDYIKIWNQQSISAELKTQLTVLCTEVYNFITSSDRRTENVTQWCKQALCWERAQKNHWTLELGFVKTLVSKASIIGALKEGAEDRKLENEIDLLKYIMSTGPDYWREVLDWGYSRRLLGESEVAILRLISNMGATGRIPSKKQAQAAIKVRDRLKAEGMASKY